MDEPNQSRTGSSSVVVVKQSEDLLPSDHGTYEDAIDIMMKAEEEDTNANEEKIFIKIKDYDMIAVDVKIEDNMDDKMKSKVESDNERLADEEEDENDNDDDSNDNDDDDFIEIIERAVPMNRICIKLSNSVQDPRKSSAIEAARVLAMGGEEIIILQKSKGCI